MPMYDYRCERCSVQFEVRQSFSDDTLTVCPSESGPTSCVAPGEGQVKKVFSGVAISFKGDGFYKNDHGANARGRNEEREASSAKDSSSKDSSSDSGSSSGKDSSSTKDSSTTDSSTKESGSGSSSDAARSKADAGASPSSSSS